MPSPQDQAVPSPQGQEGEVIRLRRTFRVAVIAAAVGASIGAGVIMTVVGAVVSVIDRPASESGKTEKTKAALQQKSTPPEQKGTAQEQKGTAQASAQPPVAPPNARRVEESPAPTEATCKDQTWPYLDGKCLTPADDRASPPADVATTGPAAAPPVAVPVTPAASTPAPAPTQASAPPASAPAPAIVQTSATARPETTGSAVQSPPQPGQPGTGVATTGVAPSDTPDFDKKSRKKVEDSRAAQQKRARPEDKGGDRRLATRPDRDSPERNSSRDAASQSSRFWSTRAAEPDDDEAMPRARTLVIVPPRSRAEVSSEDVVPTKKQRRSTRPRPEAEPPVEVRESVRRDTAGDGGRDFFGGLFGGQRD
jgi:hypothetical protein